MEHLFHLSSEDLLRISLSSVMVYLLVIFYIRLVGKRSTSQMNNFDWIVTVAIGSLVGSTIIIKDVSILDGSFAILFLLGMQYILTKLMCHYGIIKKLAKSSPTVLLYDGEYIEENMKHERIIYSEVNSAIRQKGIADVSQVYAVVLETDAKMSVITKKAVEDGDLSALNDIQLISDQLKNSELNGKKVKRQKTAAQAEGQPCD